MKLKTHNLFSAGVLAFAGSRLTHSVWWDIVSAFAVAFAANQIIDFYGHEKKAITVKRGWGPFAHKTDVIRPVRTYETHSFMRGTVYGFLPALFLYYVLLHLGGFRLSPSDLHFILLQGILAGPAHLFADWPTEGGIWVKRKGRWVKWSIAHFKYDDFLINLIFAGFGIFLLFFIVKKYIPAFYVDEIKRLLLTI